jgi:HD superfamily phosphohydrolase
MNIYDNIHGYIHLDKIASKIVDTNVFQRLRNIHQTGILYLVFPTATHSRFEHSIGTYHLAKLMISTLKNKHPELNIDEEIIMLVSIAGLCHDLGHLLFSHLFDDYFLNKLDYISENKTHEIRSIYLLKYVVQKYNIELNNNQIKVISDLINPKNAEYSKWKNKYQIGKWIFQIISNPINSIDIDKFDYLIRDTQAVGLKFSFDFSRIINDAKIIDNNICYSKNCSEDIYHMFFIRYRLHREIYNHKAVKAIEIILIKYLFELESTIKISDYLYDAEKMILLVDTFIWNQNHKLLNDIYERKIPKLIYQDISINPIEFDKQKLIETFPFESYQIIEYKVGYISGNKSTNPLKLIKFYNLKTGNIINDYNIKNFSLLINHKYQEYYLRIYLLDQNLIKDFENYFNLLQKIEI